MCWVMLSKLSRIRHRDKQEYSIGYLSFFPVNNFVHRKINFEGMVNFKGELNVLGNVVEALKDSSSR